MEPLGLNQAVTVAFTLDPANYKRLEKLVEKFEMNKSKFMRELTIKTLDMYDENVEEEEK